MWKNRIYFIIAGFILIILIFLILYRFLSDKKKLFVRLFAYSFLLEVSISPIRGYVSFMACTAVGFILFIILTYYLLTKYFQKVSAEKILIVVLAGLFVLDLPHFFDFKSTLISLPDAFFHLFGVLVGYLLFKIKSYYKWIVLVIASIACIFTVARGYGLWINKLNYGTFTGEIKEEKITKEAIFKDSRDSSIYMNNLKGKVVLLDFWYSRCGVCFKKFPEVQKEYNKYKVNPKVRFYSVNSFYKEFDKDSDAFRIIKERGYSFPVLICKDKALLKELKITGYPTVLIINQKGRLVFRGDINCADKKIEDLLKESN